MAVSNWARVFSLPVMFVCEDNSFAATTRTDEVTAGEGPAARAASLGIPPTRVDGNDVLEVEAAAREAAARAREGEGPTFLECRTYRWKGHVGPGEDFDLGYRGRDEFERWKKRDPVLAFRSHLIAERTCDENTLLEIETEVDTALDEAVAHARETPFPSIESLVTDVHSI